MMMACRNQKKSPLLGGARNQRHQLQPRPLMSQARYSDLRQLPRHQQYPDCMFQLREL